MGGNALKNTETERKHKVEYDLITGFVCTKLKEMFPQARMTPVIGYRLKQSFGDSDILLASDTLPPDWKQQVEGMFKPNEIVNNGNVMSFDVMKMQVDIITVPDKELHIASTYFAFNDLGNLMGRIAHKMGFKYGSDGLWKILRDEKDQKVEDILVTQQPSEIFSFLGYDWVRFTEGFNTLEDIFKYAASSPYFNRQIYLLDNRNHVSRTRDAKRPSYNAFLKWIEDKPELDKYEWTTYSPTAPMSERGDNHRKFLDRACNVFTDLKIRVDTALIRHEVIQKSKEKFNGEIVGTITGLKGKDLGAFMARCRENYPDKGLRPFELWVSNCTPLVIKDYIWHRFVSEAQR